QRDYRFDRRNLATQIFLQRFLVARDGLIGRAVVAIEEIAVALEIFEYAQVVVRGLPEVSHEEAYRISLRHCEVPERVPVRVWHKRRSYGTGAPRSRSPARSDGPTQERPYRMRPRRAAHASKAPLLRLLVYNIRYATGTGPAFHLPLPGA